jgi:rhodanese-related sulfurtransferase
MRHTNLLKVIWVILLSAILYTPCAGAEFKELSPAELNSLHTPQTLVVDIRRPEEWSKEGIIANSKLLTFFNRQGHFDLPDWLSKFAQLKKTKETAIVLVCASGNRSKIVAKLLSTELNMNKISHLKNGIKGWKQQGHLTINPDLKL